MKPITWSVRAACVAAALGWASSALGQPGTSVAKEQFQAAQRRYDSGDYAGAVQMFQEAWENSASPNARLYIARSLRELGKLTAAYNEMEATHRDASAAAAKDDKYNSTRDASAVELLQLTRRIGLVRLAVHDSAKDAAIELDGRAIHPADFGAAMPLDAGSHKLVVKRGEELIEERDIDVRAGSQLSIPIAILPKPVAAPPPPPPPPENASIELTTLGFVTGGVGVATLIAALGTGLAADGELSSLEEDCLGTRCTDPAKADAIDRGKALEDASTATLIVGGVLTGAGAALVTVGLLGGGDGSDQATLRLGPSGASVRGRF